MKGDLCHRYAVPRDCKGMGGAVPWASAHGYRYVSATRFKTGESVKEVSMVL
jgi:hypothetical protein